MKSTTSRSRLVRGSGWLLGRTTGMGGGSLDGRDGQEIVGGRSELDMEEEVEMAATWRSGGGGDSTRAAAAVEAWGRRRRGDDGEVSVAGARSGGGRCGGAGGTDACGGGGGDGGWTPSPAFLEQPLERESTPFFHQMMARVWGGGPFPSYRTHNWLRGERAHLRPTTQNPKYS